MNKLKKIIEYGLYLLVFLLPIQTRWIVKAGEIGGAYSEYGTISLYGADILLFLLLVLLIVYKLRVTSCELRVTRIWWVIAGLELMVFVSIFVASDKVLALYRYGVFLSGVGLFWLVTSAGYNRVKLIYAFLAGILLQAVLGIWQFLTQSSFANKWLGLAFHDAGALGTSVIETVGADGVGDPSTWLGAGRWLRAYGGLDHPNVLGGLLVVGILTMAYLMLGRKQIANEFSIFNFQFSNNFQFSIFNFSIFIILIACLFFTFSRSAWLGLVVGLMVMLGTAVIRKDYWAQKKILEAVLAGAVMVFILFNIYGNLVSTRLSQTGRLEVKSTNERIESYKDAWGVIKSNWWLGAGIGNYAISDFGFRISDFKMENPANLQSKISAAGT
ncbi:MAG: O-antigen ligase family protein [Planctomycetes bacterium]|nr:O-antigen ligase family protein [Planctomycetota bacterium]